MRLTEIAFGTAQPVESYGPGFFRIGGKVLQGAVIITPEGAGPLALAGRIDVLLLGMGPAIAPIPRDFRQALEGAGIGVEPMNTPAACRTYNVLLGEGRRVAACLMPMP